MVMILAVLVVATLRWSAPAQDLEVDYVKKAETEFEAKNYAAAIVAYERLAQIGNERQEVLFKMAKTYEWTRDVDRCYKIMNQIAQHDQDGGYGNAHLWLASYLMATRNDPIARQEAMNHLRRATKALDVVDKDAVRVEIAKLHMNNSVNSKTRDESEKELKAAASVLEELVKRYPDGYLLYANVLLRQEKWDEAKAAGRKAVQHFEPRATRDKFNWVATSDLASSLMLAEDFDGAIKALTDFPAPALVRPRVAAAYFFWQQSVAKKSPENVVKRLELIHEGLKFEPGNPGLLQALLSMLGSDEKSAAKVRELLPKIAALSRNTASVHLLQGMDAYRRKDLSKVEARKTAIFHLDAAWKLDPSLLTVANNLAFILSEGDNPDLDRALELINHAIERVPQQPDYYATRGKIYLKQKKWDLAIIDLESIGWFEFDIPDLRLAIAEGYDNLDVADAKAIAEWNRERHAELEKLRKR